MAKVLAEEEWRRISVRKGVYDDLQALWQGDKEAQRRRQKFTPWVDMLLRETMVEYRRLHQMRKIRAPIPESDVQVTVS